jgi:uncharacterized membrane protein YccC
MASQVSPRPRSAFWAAVTQFDKSKMSVPLALRNAIGVALPLAAGVAVGQPIAGAVMCTGALNVSFSDGNDPYGQRARRMLMSSFLGAFAICVGAISGNNSVAAVTLTACWAFVAGLMVSVSPTAGDLGLVSLVALVVFHARPMPPGEAALAGAAALGGGLLQTGLSLLLWPMQKYGPERRQLGLLYQDLSRMTTEPVDGLDAPRASAAVTETRQALAVVARQHTLEAIRCISLLNQAERIRLSLLTLARLRARLARDEDGQAGAEIVEEVLSLASLVMRSIGNLLMREEADDGTSAWCAELQELAGPLEELAKKDKARKESAAFLTAVLSSARFQTDALAGQLRAAVDLAAAATPEGAQAFERVDEAKPWYLRWRGSVATLRANLHFESAAFRHAIRLAVCTALGEGFGRSLSWQRTYWLPMTVAIILKPDFTATFSRGVLRLAGTLGGLALSTVLFHFLPSGMGAEIVLVAALTFAMRWAGQANYGILVAAVSALVVVLVAISGVAPQDVIWARGLNTAAGGLLALGAYAIWPTWQRTQIREATAQMLDAYRDYFRAVTQVFLQPQMLDYNRLDHARMAARLARSNVEASLDRMTAEPLVKPQWLNEWNAMLASSHGLINAVMALEGALPGPGSPPAPDSLRTFANDVEVTMHSLAAVLRGSTLLANALPDLREDYKRLMQSGDSGSGRFALVGMETDRLTNRLNTLSEQVLRWVAAHPKPMTFPVSFGELR